MRKNKNPLTNNILQRKSKTNKYTRLMAKHIIPIFVQKSEIWYNPFIY